MEKARIMHMIAEALLADDKPAALRTLAAECPFTMTTGGKRKYTDRQRMAIYRRDGFIDRYSGKKLVNPGLLRVISRYFPEAFPYDPHWKPAACHALYWELTPTLDHVVPVFHGGADDASNLVTTSMLCNSRKANWTLEEMGWTLHPAAPDGQWDGLTGLFLQLVRKDPGLEANKAIKHWYAVSKES